jgi:hypothetical protein
MPKYSLRSVRAGAWKVVPLLLVCSFGLGCGKSKGGVTGKVTYKNAPLKNAWITLIPSQGQDAPSPVQSSEDGSYTIKDVPFGEYKIIVSCVDQKEVKAAQTDAAKKAGSGRTAKAIIPRGSSTGKSLIPVKYGDASRSLLTVNVDKESTPYDIVLKD